MGSHSCEPISLTRFLAIKKEKIKTNIPINLGSILVKKNIRKDILSGPIEKKIVLPISARINDRKFRISIDFQKVPLSIVPLVDSKRNFRSIHTFYLMVLTFVLYFC